MNSSSRIPLALGAALASPMVLIVVLMAPLMTQGSASASPSPASTGSQCGQPALNVGDTLPGMGGPLGGMGGIGGTLGGKLAADQYANAQSIYAIAYGRSGSDQAALDALTAALQASGLHLNPQGAAADAIGLFGQRPSRGWGTPDQLRDPGYATTAFVDALTATSGWQSQPPAQAAAAVQQIGTAADYAPYAEAAARLTSTFDGMSNACAMDSALPTSLPTGADSGLPKGYTIPAGAPPAVRTAIAFALSKVGMPYQWGGVGNPSYDCSGLVQMAYKAAGISISRTTYEQVFNGAPVYSLGSLHPGDLLFTAGSDGTASNPGHVGIYIGAGYLVQAPHTGVNITVSTLASWSKDIVAMREIVPWP